MEPELSEKDQNYILKKLSTTAIVVFFVVIFISSYLVFGKLLHIRQARIDAVIAQEVSHKEVILDSLINGSPEAVQNSFLQSVASGENDKYAKSAAYFIMHRYFDNKGNVYELYEYSHSDPRLSFLTEAEQIYPDIFAKIKEKTLPKTFSEEGTYAYLAYLEILDKKGYADIATQGTAANQYAKMAYIGKMQSSDKDLKNLNETQEKNLEKSMMFARSASKEVASIVNARTVPDSVYVADVVIGLNQYAYSLRYFKYFGLPFESPKTPEEIFALTTEYATKNVPTLSKFTHLINASSLTLIDGDSNEITKILKPFTDYNLAYTPRDYSVVDRVIKARLGTEKEGVYSRENIVAIAKKSADFKKWLIRAGWTEDDFK